MKNNQGVTLIELIIVMAIASILAGGSIIGVRLLGVGSAKRNANRIDSMLDFVQLQNMTKSKVHYLIISEENGTYVMKVRAGAGTEDPILAKEELKLVRGEITYQRKYDGTTYLLSSTPVPGRTISPKLEICFRKDTGGVSMNTQGDIITRIGVTSAGRSYTIHLVEATGKHYID